MRDILSRRSSVEICRASIGNNLSIYRSKLGHNQAIMAVVKADAYGHGDQM